MEDDKKSVGSLIDSSFRPNRYAGMAPYGEALDKMRELYEGSGQSNLVIMKSFNNGTWYKATFNVRDNNLIGKGKTAEDALVDLMSEVSTELVQCLYLLESDPDYIILDGKEAVRGERAR